MYVCVPYLKSATTGTTTEAAAGTAAYWQQSMLSIEREQCACVCAASDSATATAAAALAVAGACGLDCWQLSG